MKRTRSHENLPSAKRARTESNGLISSIFGSAMDLLQSGYRYFFSSDQECSTLERQDLDVRDNEDDNIKDESLDYSSLSLELLEKTQSAFNYDDNFTVEAEGFINEPLTASGEFDNAIDTEDFSLAQDLYLSIHIYWMNKTRKALLLCIKLY